LYKVANSAILEKPKAKVSKAMVERLKGWLKTGPKFHHFSSGKPTKTKPKPDKKPEEAEARIEAEPAKTSEEENGNIRYILKLQSAQKRDILEAAERVKQGCSKDETGRLVLKDEQVPVIAMTIHLETGHAGVETTLKTAEKFKNPLLKNHIEAIRKKCFACLENKLPRAMKRPFGSMISAKERNEVLHADYLKLDTEHVLVIRDDLSKKVELIIVERPTALATMEAILYWRARYGIATVTTIVTDRGSHFANQLVEALLGKLRIAHHFTVAYTPFSNGKIERTVGSVVKLMRVLAVEQRSKQVNVDKLLPEVQYLLNNLPRKSLGGLSPNQVFLGGESIVDMVARVHVDATDAIRYGRYKPKVRQLARDLADQLETNRYKVQEYKGSQIKPKGKGYVIEFEIGDFVMVATPIAVSKAKLEPNWTGPYQVVKPISRFVYIVRHLLSSKEKEIHWTRMYYYSGKDDITVRELEPQVMYSTREIGKVVKAGVKDGIDSLLIKFRGSEEKKWIAVDEALEVDYEKVISFLRKLIA